MILLGEPSEAEHSNGGGGDTPAGSQPDSQATSDEPVDRHGRGMHVDTDPIEELCMRKEWAMLAREEEAQQEVEHNGPSFVQSRAASGVPQLPLYCPTEEADDSVNTAAVPILDQVAHFTVSCGLVKEAAPLLLPKMVSTVYGDAYARTVGSAGWPVAGTAP
eukprot:g10577.t1